MSSSSSSNANAPLDASNKLGAGSTSTAGTSSANQTVRSSPSPPLPSARLTNNPIQNPSIISSGGAIGKQFNPDGAIGQIGEKVGGPFSKDGVIGSQFDASKNGIAGHVERAVDGPSNPAQKKCAVK